MPAITTDLNDLAYWFPLLRATGVPVPRTEIVTTAVQLVDVLDGTKPDGYDEFIAELGQAVERLGPGPVFLRTGHTSDKHDWERTCYLKSVDDLPNHVAELVEFSELADIMGLPTSTWAVRELLPLMAWFRAFRGMPIAVERRWFFRDNQPICNHEYWPPDSIQQPLTTSYRRRLHEMETLGTAPVEMCRQREIVERVAAGFDGAWSLDLARTRDGRWWALDMAQMERSFHWPDCPNKPAE